MNQPRQFRLTSKGVSAMRRNGTLHRDLKITEWMERSQPYGEYQAGTGAFVIVTPTGDLSVGPDDWIIRCAGRFQPCPDQVFSAIATGAEMYEPSLCSECCDAVPPDELSPIPSSGARTVRTACRSTSSSSRSRTHQLSWTETLCPNRTRRR
jgi:hypothetical protein